MTKIVFILIFFVSTLGQLLCKAQALTVIDASKSYTALVGGQVWAVEDAQHRLTIAQVTQLPDTAWTVPSEVQTNFGVSNSAFWVRFKYYSPTPGRLYFCLLNQLVDTAEFYIVREGQTVFRVQNIPEKAEFNLPNSPFLLPLLSDTVVCYVRATARIPVYIPMHLLHEKNLNAYFLWTYASDFLFFGAILIMMLYNVFLAVTTRNLVYFYYISYSFFVLATVIYIRGFLSPLLGDYSQLIEDNSAYIVGPGSIFLCLFAMEFLAMKNIYKLGYQILLVLAVLSFANMVLFSFIGFNITLEISQILTLTINFLVAWCALVVYKRQKQKDALLFVIAFSAYLVLYSSLNLVFLNVINAYFISIYFLHIGSTIELVLFSIALGNQINAYRKESIMAQAENLRLVQEQNVVLEQKVSERTHELNQTLETVAKQRDNIISSINYALRIQNAIIPKEEELLKYLDCFVFFRPRDIVSGDFYWFAEKDHCQILAVADCTGHGVSGAFMTMIGNNILNQIVHNQEIHAPSEILNFMCPLLSKTLLHSKGRVKDGMDISIITLYGQPKATEKICYSGAMNPLYIVQNKEFREIKADKMPIEVLTETNRYYTQHELVPDGNTMLYLLSDGYQDQFSGPQNTKFMAKRLKQLLFSIAHEDINVQKGQLKTTFEEWKGTKKQTDDVLLVGLRV